MRLNLILNPNASVFALLSSPNGASGALWSLSAYGRTCFPFVRKGAVSQL